MEELSDEARRRRAIAWAMALTADTPLAPQAYERELRWSREGAQKQDVYFLSHERRKEQEDAR